MPEAATDGTDTGARDAPLLELPTLSVYTTWLHEDDRVGSLALGLQLYELLTRPSGDALAAGAGVPVFPGAAADQVDPTAAQRTLVIPVLGSTAFQYGAPTVKESFGAWLSALEPDRRGQVLALPRSRQLPSRLGEFNVEWLPVEREGEDADRQQTVAQVVRTLDVLLNSQEEATAPATASRTGPSLFISLAGRDVAGASDEAERIAEDIRHAGEQGGFFSSCELLHGDLPSSRLDADSRGVLVAVHSDTYSSWERCQRHLRTAKRLQLPILDVHVLRRGEPRLPIHLSNVPSVVWNGNAGQIVTRTMVQWVRARLHEREAERIARAARLPLHRALWRPPERLDVSSGVLKADRAQVVMYPDPPLSATAREDLHQAAPRVHLATPSTAFRYLDGGGPATETPLGDMQVAISLSKIQDVGGAESNAGLTQHHLDDVVVQVARSLVAAGAALAYGGDFRDRRAAGYLELLSTLVASHNQTDRPEADCLHSYLAAVITDAQDLPLRVHHLGHPAPDGPQPQLPPPEADVGDRRPFYFSDMRRAMAERVDACVVLGGQASPQKEQGGEGYGGRYPGVIEEVWRMLEANKPVYVCGGFGGAAAMVAQLLSGGETPAALQDALWSEDSTLAARADAFARDPFREQLQLPATMSELVERIRKLAAKRMANDEESVQWNGLRRDESELLFRTRDPVTIAALIFKGLMRVQRNRVAGKLEIELVRGSVLHARDLDVLSVPVCNRVPIGGAAGAVDRALGGLPSRAERDGHRLVEVGSDTLRVNWLHLANLGDTLDPQALVGRVRKATAGLVDDVERYGFRRVGVVAFGATLVEDARDVVRAMLQELRSLPDETRLVWYERHEGRYDEIKEVLSDAAVERSADNAVRRPEGRYDETKGVPSEAADERTADNTVSLTTRVVSMEDRTEDVRATVLLQVRLEDDQLESVVVPPAGTAVASTRRCPLSAEALNALSQGGGKSGLSTPPVEELERRGRALTELLLGEHGRDVLVRHKDTPMLVVHNALASKLPFELLWTDGPEGRVFPANRGGISRRLAAEGLSAGAMFARQPKPTSRVLLIVDPLDDLPGARAEGEAIHRVLTLLEKQRLVTVTVLGGRGITHLNGEAVAGPATLANTLDELARSDVVHFCGHAFFTGTGSEESGLMLSDDNLTLDGLRKLCSVPRFAFVNACEAGRMRGGDAEGEETIQAESHGGERHGDAAVGSDARDAPGPGMEAEGGEVTSESLRLVAREADAFAEFFLRAGIEAYLGTCWRVGDVSAQRFGHEVYQGLAAAKPLSEAVRDARAALFLKPYKDWGNYLLFGEGQFTLVPDG